MPGYYALRNALLGGRGKGKGKGEGKGEGKKVSGVCYAFQKGECNRGDGCRFLHQ